MWNGCGGVVVELGRHGQRANHKPWPHIAKALRARNVYRTMMCVHTRLWWVFPTKSSVATRKLATYITPTMQSRGRQSVRGSRKKARTAWPEPEPHINAHSLTVWRIAAYHSHAPRRRLIRLVFVAASIVLQVSATHSVTCDRNAPSHTARISTWTHYTSAAIKKTFCDVRLLE